MPEESIILYIYVEVLPLVIGTGLFCKEAGANEIIVDQNNRLASGGMEDRLLLDSLWTMTFVDYSNLMTKPEIYYSDKEVPHGLILKDRTSKVDTFDNKDILLYSQGPKGRWV